MMMTIVYKNTPLHCCASVVKY